MFAIGKSAHLESMPTWLKELYDMLFLGKSAHPEGMPTWLKEEYDVLFSFSLSCPAD